MGRSSPCPLLLLVFKTRAAAAARAGAPPSTPTVAPLLVPPFLSQPCRIPLLPRSLPVSLRRIPPARGSPPPLPNAAARQFKQRRQAFKKLRQAESLGRPPSTGDDTHTTDRGAWRVHRRCTRVHNSLRGRREGGACAASLFQRRPAAPPLPCLASSDSPACVPVLLCVSASSVCREDQGRW
jgi:hypothetical protein